jgi:hypothetical protein
MPVSDSVLLLYAGAHKISLKYKNVVVSKSGSPGPVPNSYFLYYIFIKALILIKFEHNAYLSHFLNKYKQK